MNGQPPTARNLAQAEFSEHHPSGKEAFRSGMSLFGSIFEQRSHFSTGRGGPGLLVAIPCQLKVSRHEIRRDTALQDFLAIGMTAKFGEKPGVRDRGRPGTCADRAVVIFQGLLTVGSDSASRPVRPADHSNCPGRSCFGSLEVQLESRFRIGVL